MGMSELDANLCSVSFQKWKSQIEGLTLQTIISFIFL